MMNYELRLSSEAERCIEEQLQWYEAAEQDGGSELADRWFDLLEAALEALGQHPERHGFAPENGRWMPEIAIRQMRFKPWKTSSAWRILYVMISDKAGDPPFDSVTKPAGRWVTRPVSAGGFGDLGALAFDGRACHERCWRVIRNSPTLNRQDDARRLEAQRYP